MRAAGVALGVCLGMVVSLAATPSARAATLTIVVNDGVNEGFNDTTHADPVTGNPGTTRGQQRLNVFQAAAAVWGDALTSPVTILVRAQFDVLTCNASSAVLGSAGPTTAHRDFSGAPISSMYYVQAVANSRSGVDLSAANPDINATFNVRLDDADPNCLGGLTWWYGIGAAPQGGAIDLYTTVLHELGHGLGNLSLHNLGTGAKLNGFDDAYLRLLYDEVAGIAWPAMTNGQRVASSINTGNLTWLGAAANSRAAAFGAGTTNGHLRLYAPNPVQSGSSVSHWDTALTPNELMEPILTSNAEDYVTYSLMGDVGWVMSLLFKDGFESGNVHFWTDRVP